MSQPRKQKWFFLRGLIREAGHWSGFLERFNAAFPDREAIPLDLPGNGVHYREKSPLSIPEMATAMRTEFFARRGEENHLFALSLGAMVGVEWMHRWPGDFSSAVLLNTSLRGLSPLHHRLQPRNYLRILKMVFASDPAFVERNILQITSYKQERFIELEQAWTKIRQDRPVSICNSIRQLIAAARFHPPQEKPILPLMILTGARDQLVNSACSLALARHWGMEARVHPQAGHDITLDAPEWVIEQLRAFSQNWESAREK